MKLNEIKPNTNNPRKVSAKKMEALVKSITDFPQMMELRPIIIDEENVILGGNMRFIALQKIYGKNGEVPDLWIRRADSLTDEEKRRFIITDNNNFGEWDYEELKSDWNLDELVDFGLDLPDDFFDKENSVEKPEEKQLKPFNSAHILISYKPDRHDEIINVIDSLLNDDEIEILQSAN